MGFTNSSYTRKAERSALPIDAVPSTRTVQRTDGFEVTWDEEDRGHDWDFWDSQIKKVIDWLPLGQAEGGMGSGNVSKDL